jgi:hypothetical protein
MYDLLNDELNQSAGRFDQIKVASLFQQCLINIFKDTSASTKQFIDAVTVSKRAGEGTRGWDVLFIDVTIDYPLNSVLSQGTIQKYRKIFKLILLLNVFLVE